MSKSRHHGKICIALYIIAGVFFLLALPLVAFGVFGLLGVLADVSRAENRQFGLGFLGYAAFPVGVGLIALVAAPLIRSPVKDA